MHKGIFRHSYVSNLLVSMIIHDHLLYSIARSIRGEAPLAESQQGLFHAMSVPDECVRNRHIFLNQ